MTASARLMIPAAAIVAAFSFAADAATYVNLSERDKAAVESAIRNELKDPDSAKFKDFVARADATSRGTFHVCGLVNAKNSFGGYSGFTIFYTVLFRSEASGGAIISFAAVASIGDTALYMCKRNGVLN